MAAMSTATLMVSSPDRKGIVMSVAQLLNGHGANIIESDQHTDAIAGMYFQRVRFDASTMTTDRSMLEREIGGVCDEFGMNWRLSFTGDARRIAVLCSKQEHCLYDLLIRYKAGELPCHIAMVISNHPDLEHVSRHFDIPFHHLPVTNETRPKQEAQITQLVERANVNMIVLARYMQILTPEFVNHFPYRIINIHHSFLPAFVGANPYKQAYEKGVKVIGATSHYVTPELDQGPIIEQETIRCSHHDSLDDLVRKGKDLEKRVLANAVRAHLQDRVLVYGGKTVVFE
jgi:formyltetrahydrofolate deformylase